MLIRIPSVYLDQEFKQYYKDIEQTLKVEPAYYAHVDLSSLCIRPMNTTQVLLMCNWDKKVIDWLTWVNRNICLKIGLDTEKTTMVKLRIATGMLNNIESLTNLEKIQIHSNLANNIHEEIVLIRMDGLPF